MQTRPAGEYSSVRWGGSAENSGTEQFKSEFVVCCTRPLFVQDDVSLRASGGSRQTNTGEGWVGGLIGLSSVDR